MSNLSQKWQTKRPVKVALKPAQRELLGHQFFVTPIKRVVDIQSMTTLPLTKGGRAML